MDAIINSTVSTFPPEVKQSKPKPKIILLIEGIIVFLAAAIFVYLALQYVYVEISKERLEKF